MINQGIYERCVKLLTSPNSPVDTTHFALGLSIIEPGHVHEVHQHPDSEEAIVVLEGRGSGTVAGEPVKLEPGTVIRVRPAEPHGFTNEGETPLKLLWVYSPPGAEEKFLKAREPNEE